MSLIKRQSIWAAKNFDIIKTARSDYYYCDNINDNTMEKLMPIKIDAISDTDYDLSIHIPNCDDITHHYWSYTIYGGPPVYVLDRNKLIYEFDDKEIFLFAKLKFISFYILNCRWLVLIYGDYSDDYKVIIWVYDILNEYPPDKHILSELTQVRGAEMVITYSNSNYIIFYTPQKIVKLTITYPSDDCIKPEIVYKTVNNNLQAKNPGGFNVGKFSLIPGYDIHTNTKKINVYYIPRYFEDLEDRFHSLKKAAGFIGAIDPDTLENKSANKLAEIRFITKPFQGLYEYLAPDIVIHRPSLEFTKREQYLTLLTENGHQIQVNIHDYETNKKQRVFEVLYMKDNGIISTIIFKSFVQKSSCLIYQVNRIKKTIIYRKIYLPIDIILKRWHVLEDGSIIIRDETLNGNILRTIFPSKANIYNIPTKLPVLVLSKIAVFLQQKIIHY